MMCFRMIFLTIMMIMSFFSCLGCYQSPTETPPANPGMEQPQLAPLANQEDTDILLMWPAKEAGPTGSVRQYPVDQNISDSDIEDIFLKYSRNDHSANTDLLFACNADSIVPYLASENTQIKLQAISILGAIGDTSTIELLMELLSENNPGYADYALGSIDIIIRRHHIRVGDLRSLQPHLAQYALERSWDIEIAINLLGNTGNPKNLMPIMMVRERAQASIARNDVSSRVGQRRYHVCLQAMAKLGDQASAQEIIGMLHSVDPKQRGRAVQSIGYLGKEWTHYLLPLIDDRAQAFAAVGADTTTYFYRVCDVVVNVITMAYSLPPLHHDIPGSFSDQQLAEVKKWMNEHITGQ